MPGRRLTIRSDSLATLQLIECWLIQSWKYQGGALDSPNLTSSGKIQPKRLIDVGTKDDNRLFLSVDPRERQEDSRYICLSHCWSYGHPLRTTTVTLPARTKRICFSDLSQTFRDTIALTRYLGIRYLWIDSLCIVQDSIIDWQEESAKMGLYYTSS
jgi:Heterokaryon incompatibility protein (HET)